MDKILMKNGENSFYFANLTRDKIDVKFQVMDIIVAISEDMNTRVKILRFDTLDELNTYLVKNFDFDEEYFLSEVMDSFLKVYGNAYLEAKGGHIAITISTFPRKMF